MEALDLEISTNNNFSGANTSFDSTQIQNKTHKFLEQSRSVVMLVSSEVPSKIAACQSILSNNLDLHSLAYSWANDPTTLPEVLAHISSTGNLSILTSVAENANVSDTTLQRLANHYNPVVRAAVVENKKVSFSILAALSEDDHPDVRFAVAENANVSISILNKLSNDENPYVACRACKTLQRVSTEQTKISWCRKCSVYYLNVF